MKIIAEESKNKQLKMIDDSPTCRNCGKKLRRNYNNTRWEHDVAWNVQPICGNPQSNIRYKRSKNVHILGHKVK